MRKFGHRFAAGLMAAIAVMSTLTVSAFAEKFTPSVTQKGAPSVVQVKNSAFEDVSAIIENDQMEEVAGVPEGDLIVTPVAKAEEAQETIRDNLENAYQQLDAAKDLSKIAPELKDKVARLNEAADNGKKIKVKDLVVRDLFDVSVSGRYQEILNREENHITIRFQVDLDPDETLIVLHNHEGDHWEVISDDAIERHKNGDVSITFTSLSPIAFVVNMPAAAGEGFHWWIIIGVLLIAAACVVLYVLAKKSGKKTNRKDKTRV